MKRKFSLFLIFIMALVTGCDRYEHSNPFDPEYTGQFWNSAFANLIVSGFTVNERIPDINNRYFELNPTIKNIGSSAAKGVQATISENNSIAELVYHTTVHLGAILPGDSVSADWQRFFDVFEFRIPRSTFPPVHVIFYFGITDEGGNNWSDSIEVVISESGAFLSISSYSLQEKTPYFSYRYFELNPTIKNSGTEEATYIEATISENHAMVELVFSTTIEYQNIAPGDSASADWPYVFEFRIPTTAQTPMTTQFFFEMTDLTRTFWYDSLEVLIP